MNPKQLLALLFLLTFFYPALFSQGYFCDIIDSLYQSPQYQLTSCAQSTYYAGEEDFPNHRAVFTINVNIHFVLSTEGGGNWNEIHNGMSIPNVYFGTTQPRVRLCTV